MWRGCAMPCSSLKIGLIPQDFLGWQGGRELFQLIALSLQLNLQTGDELSIAAGMGSGGPARHLALAARRRLAGLIRGPRQRQAPDLDSLVGLDIPVIRGRRFDVVGPFSRPPIGVRIPWVGYIPDVQHRRLPDMFSASEREQRDRNFRALLSQAKVVLVNAADVANDLRHFYPQFRAQIVPLPFAACADPDWFADTHAVRARYGIFDSFFLVSNQLWKHKNHAVVLRAVALARQEGVPIRVVFTGDTRDYRHPHHFSELRDRIAWMGISDDVRILGFIPKQDQIQLMREARAVVQPSLFEGGPGGGSVYNAIALGRPVIMSDLPVNREIETLATHYFDPVDPRDLLKKLRAIQARAATPVDPATLLREGEDRRRLFGLALRRAFETACQR